MKVLHLSHSDLFGGAAISAYKIHKAIQLQKINSKMLVVKKLSKDNSVFKLKSKRHLFFYKLKNYLFILLNRINKNKTPRSYNFFSSIYLINQINEIKPDIIFVHWVHAEMISISDIKKIDKKTIFFLHDMWWFLKTEHYRNCSHKINYFSFLDNFIFNKKKKVRFKNIYTPSKWMMKQAKKSTLMKNSKITIVPYPVDTNVFKTVKKKYIKNNVKTILFVGFGKIDAERKVLDLFEKIINELKIKNLNIIIIGDIDPKKFDLEKYNYTFYKKIQNVRALSKIYSKSDIFIFTSRQDNFPNVVLEAQSCGLPIISFDSGGVKEININNVTGFVIKSFNITKYVKKLEYLINNDKLIKKFSINARKNALKNYSFNIISKKYLKLLNDFS